ncbi:glycosyltransferase family 4 protein, partial [Candidatus Woesearchaeota archaeon]|nr:glycosyltransferase family 4 protein [Candidatus Woesearchaeota archaeon]
PDFRIYSWRTQKKTIGFFCAHYHWDKGYSVTSVIHDQLEMNVRHGYKAVLFVLPVFKDNDKVPKGVEIRKVVPQLILEKYKNYGQPDDFKQDVKQVVSSLKEHAQDIDIMIAHDMHFIDTYLPYCAAIHEVCQYDLIKARWLLWTHSAPSARNIQDGNIHNSRFNKPRNAKLVYLNNYHTLHLAEMYGTWLSEVRVVHNSVDPRTFLNLHPFVDKLISKYNLLSADYLAVYPLSSTRMVDGKQVHKAVKLMAEIKKRGYNVKYIVANAHANGEREKKTIQDLQKMFMDWGLSSSEVIFTSLEQSPEYEAGVPREVVSQLFQLSNIFIFPTISENCSLILLEAMLSKNLLVLNADVPQLREFGKENALYMNFSGKDSKTNYANEDQYYAEWAAIIENKMKQQTNLLGQRDLLKNYNLDYIFKHFIEILYYE